MYKRQLDVCKLIVNKIRSWSVWHSELQLSLDQHLVISVILVAGRVRREAEVWQSNSSIFPPRMK